MLCQLTFFLTLGLAYAQDEAAAGEDAPAAEEAPAAEDAPAAEEAPAAGEAKKPIRTGPPPGMPAFEIIREDHAKVKAEEKWKAETLDRYLRQSKYVLIGTILSQRQSLENQGQDMVIEVDVLEWIRGSSDDFLTLRVPFSAPYVPGYPETVPPTIVNSYEMLIFVDSHMRVVEGNGMFVVEGDYAWRNKRPSIFLNPRHDRDWEFELPIDDYMMYEISGLRNKIRNADPNKTPGIETFFSKREKEE
jgi:hypothetical protein